MKTLRDLKKLTTLLKEHQYLSSTISILSWDQECYMPSGGAEARANQLAYLMRLLHEKQVDDLMCEALSECVELETGNLKGGAADWHPQARGLLKEVWKDYHRAIKLPSDFIQKMGLVTSMAHQSWMTAREDNDFKKFSPHLKEIVSLKMEEASYLGGGDSLYDPLLDTFEPGLTVAQITPIFSSLRARLVELVQKITDSSISPKKDFLHQSFSSGKQLAFGIQVLEAMGYQFKNGRQDLAAHPFTTSFHPTDVRITTRIDPCDIFSSLFSSIHEGGHALYDQGLPSKYFGTPLAEPVSHGIHESQSRLWENCVGRSKPFWQHFYPILQKTFRSELEGIDLETFYAATNSVVPSLIRVEADEVTYNLHIMLRFEIEKALIEEELAVEDLPAAWNEKMENYLDIIPESDTEGVLQDIHWASGAFGYFPSYTLGNLYAAQLFKQATKELPELTANISEGKFHSLKHWLNEKIHRFGRTFRSDELITQVTGEPLNPDYFNDYLEEKFGEIYSL
ncbi:MAG: carboxypeptidase M32 [Nitrospiria bacterium]